ncbi:MAG: TonB-dependent receptor [Acidobacteriota bacterium]
MGRSPLPMRSLFFVALIALLVPDRVPGQSIQYGKLTGRVTLQTGEVLPGASVDLSSDALISGSRSTVTSLAGNYAFPNLPVGKYRVTASREGFKTVIREDIVVSADAVVTLDLVMELGEISESVVVTASGPVVDSRTSIVATTLDSDMLASLPTARDAFYDLTLTAPGMFDAGKVAAWMPSPTAYGSGTNENVFMVNGVNTTDPRASSFGSLVRVNYDLVKEVRIAALGNKAEYINATGVAVDVVTKSGGNTFSGTLSTYFQLGKPANNVPDADDDLGRDWLSVGQLARLVTTTEKDQELSLSLGGPIVKNKVWFFAAYDHAKEDLKESVWPVLVESTDRYFDFKVSAQPSENSSIWGACHIERNLFNGDSYGQEVPWDASMTYDLDQNINAISSEWQYFPSRSNLYSAKYLGFWSDWTPRLPQDAPANPGYVNWWKWKEFGVDGHFPWIEANYCSRHTVQADVTHYVEDFLGEQDIKFGVQYTTGKGNYIGGYFAGYANYAYPLRWYQDIQYCKDAYGDTGMLWYVNQVHMPPFETVRKYDQAGLFLDDQWNPSRRLTLNIGLRFDRMTSRYGDGKVYDIPSDPHDLKSSLSAVRDREGTGDVFNFKTLSPRLGLTYSLTEDARTVFRANYGRYYVPIGLDSLGVMGPDMPPMRLHRLYINMPWEVVDTNGNNYIDPEEVEAAARLLKGYKPYADEWEEWDPSWRCKVADGTKPEHTDQFTLNFEREIVRDLSFSATAIYKRSSNILANWPINRATGQPFEYERVPYTTKYGQTVDLWSIVMKDYNGDGRIDGGDLRWIMMNTDYEVRNLPKSIDGVDTDRSYGGLQLVLNKRYSNRWQLLLSFLYSSSNGPANRTNSQDFNIEGPMVMGRAWLSTLNQLVNNTEGPLPFTSKYEFKASGSYRVPKVEMDVGARFRYNSGRPVWWLDDFPVITPWSSPPGGVVNTGNKAIIVGVDPKNPLYLPPASILDLRLERAFDLGKDTSLRVILDCFNVFNAGTITNIDYHYNPGTATGLIFPPRKLRVGVSYVF